MTSKPKNKLSATVNKTPLITIATVTFNAADTLPRTLESVEKQSFSNIEHIIMDGKSKDNTVAIALDYQKRNPDRRIIVTSEPDKGLYDAMNKAIDRAKGKYIVFLNAGDKLHDKDTLKLVADKAALSPAIIYGDTNIVDNSGTFVRRRRLSPPPVLTWKSFKAGMLVCHQSFYASTSIVPHYNLKYRFSADFDWCIRIMKEAKKHNRQNELIDVPLTDYLEEGMTTANHKASLKERFHIMAHHYGLIPTILQHIWFVARAVIKK